MRPRDVIGAVVDLVALAVLQTVALRRSERKQLVWGPVPIINNKYWSLAMREAGWDSVTLMTGVASINRRDDYDLVFDDVVPPWVRSARLRRYIAPYCALAYCLRNASVLHLPFSGGPLAYTRLRRFEAALLRRARVRTVLIPFGSDVTMYSRINDPLVKHGLLQSYPQLAAAEPDIERRVRYWTENADMIVIGFTLDGMPRWDVAVGNPICIDVNEWQPADPLGADGHTGTVRVVHSTNHRGVKGTVYLEAAVKALQADGLDVELVVLEGVPNTRVREEIQRADIVADQFILHGYGLAAVEAMACARPVLCNLEDETAVRLFKVVSFYGECPIVSVTPETLGATLRTLVESPQLRVELGSTGRAYAEKYHSYDASQHLFGTIYRKLLDGEDVDVADVFHPLLSDYVRSRPTIHPPALSVGAASVVRES